MLERFVHEAPVSVGVLLRSEDFLALSDAAIRVALFRYSGDFPLPRSGVGSTGHSVGEPYAPAVPGRKEREHALQLLVAVQELIKLQKERFLRGAVDSDVESLTAAVRFPVLEDPPRHTHEVDIVRAVLLGERH